MKRALCIATAGLALLLAGCGDGSGGTASTNSADNSQATIEASLEKLSNALSGKSGDVRTVMDVALSADYGGSASERTKKLDQSVADFNSGVRVTYALGETVRINSNNTQADVCLTKKVTAPADKVGEYNDYSTFVKVGDIWKITNTTDFAMEACDDHSSLYARIRPVTAFNTGYRGIAAVSIPMDYMGCLARVSEGQSPLSIGAMLDTADANVVCGAEFQPFVKVDQSTTRVQGYRVELRKITPASGKVSVVAYFVGKENAGKRPVISVANPNNYTLDSTGKISIPVMDICAGTVTAATSTTAATCTPATGVK